MTSYFKGDQKRINHFIKVHSFAKLIGEEENLDKETMFILEASALTHDIGIKKGEELYSRNDGKIQEKLGPDEAEKMLRKLNFTDNVIDRVKFLIAHHVRCIHYIFSSVFRFSLYHLVHCSTGISEKYK